MLLVNPISVALRRPRCLWPLILFCLVACTSPANAAGPRFVSGYGIWIQPGQPEGWNTTQLAYFTDPGNLSADVSHAQADAMVRAAAAVWNVPTSSLSLVQGGQLAEHVSSGNSYFDGAGFMFPADVRTSNEASIPVAVIYDTDGSLTDLLLGSGASEPAGCLQHGVTESVDDIGPDGHIHHALLVLNGRCVGSVPEDLLQMQYQLARAFGRILGLAWSQTNDNAFTGRPQVTANQVAYWPLMHPLDIICGTYTYQCMLNPSTLRPDDLSGLATLYPVLANQVPLGKQASDTDAIWISGTNSFPTGQGMDWENFTVRRQRNGVMEDFEIVSGITGAQFQQAVASPITGVQAENSGTQNPFNEGQYSMRVVPLGGMANLFVVSQPINSLYTGDYALGPYVRPPVTPSGSSQTWFGDSVTPLPDAPVGAYQTVADASASCAPGNDGVEAAPAALDGSGWQAGQICGWGHTSWWSASVRAGHTWTLEITSQDENGLASENKMQPVVGVWNAGDPTGTAPSLGSETVPFNALAFGVTQLRMAASAADRTLRIAIGDQYGAGRPDFTYAARLLYADSVSPVSVGSGGGTITITGTGFRQGDMVRVNGVVARVTSWTATQIVAIAGPATSTGATAGQVVSVSVTDPRTAGTTAIPSALTYTAAPNLLRLVSAPANLEPNLTAAVPFSVQVVASDGFTPVLGAGVSLAVSAGQATLGLCDPATVCTAISDANGLVRTSLTGGASAAATLTATEMGAGAQVQLNLEITAPLRSVAMRRTAQYVAAGATVSWTLELDALQDGQPSSGAPVSWSSSSGAGLVLSRNAATTSQGGAAFATVNLANVAAGSVNTVTACAWTNLCATWTVYGVAPPDWRVGVATGVGQSVSQTASLSSVTFSVTDAAGHALHAAPVTVAQRVLGWQGLCRAPGPCPAAPVLANLQTSLTSDADGALTLTPLQLANMPQTVEIAAATGTQGFIALNLVKTPTP